MLIVKASMHCAFTITILFFAMIFIGDESPVDFDTNLIAGIFMGGSFIWTIAFLFCAVLLLPLAKIFKRTSYSFSFLLFAIIGFCIPMYLGYLASTIPAHGEIPEIYKEDNAKIILIIIYGGLIGAVGAVRAWCYLKGNINTNA